MFDLFKMAAIQTTISAKAFSIERKMSAMKWLFKKNVLLYIFFHFQGQFILNDKWKREAKKKNFKRQQSNAATFNYGSNKITCNHSCNMAQTVNYVRQLEKAFVLHWVSSIALSSTLFKIKDMLKKISCRSIFYIALQYENNIDCITLCCFNVDLECKIFTKIARQLH